MEAEGEVVQFGDAESQGLLTRWEFERLVLPRFHDGVK